MSDAPVEEKSKKDVTKALNAALLRAAQGGAAGAVAMGINVSVTGALRLSSPHFPT